MTFRSEGEVKFLRPMKFSPYFLSFFPFSSVLLVFKLAAAAAFVAAEVEEKRRYSVRNCSVMPGTRFG